MTDIILPGVLEAEIMVGTVDFKTVAQVFHDKGGMEGYPTRRKLDEYLREKPLS